MNAFHAQHYNLVAARLREQFPTNDQNTDLTTLVKRGTIIELAFSFAESFIKDNPDFDVMRFLDACSPDPEIYPISELWEDRVCVENGS